MEPNYEYSDAGYPVKEPVPYFSILLREPNKIRLINVGPELVSAIQERLEQLITVETFGYVIFKDYLQTSFTGRFNIYDLVLEKPYFEKPEEDMKNPSVTKEDMTLVKVAFCRILGTLFYYGYDIVVSSDLARDALTHSAVFFRLRDPRRDVFPVHYYSHKFICVAPFGIDSILLINIPKVAVEPLLKVSQTISFSTRIIIYLYTYFRVHYLPEMQLGEVAQNRSRENSVTESSQSILKNYLNFLYYTILF